MKKTFPLTAPNKAPARQVEAVKFEIRKYLARERRKTPKEGSDFWDFDCRVGKDAESADVITAAEINKGIDQVALSNSDKVYVEILAKPGFKTKKPGV